MVGRLHEVRSTADGPVRLMSTPATLLCPVEHIVVVECN